jgi:hypothetical protein
MEVFLVAYTRFNLFLKFFPYETIQSDQKENKSSVPSHLLFYRDACLTLTRTWNYACYTLIKMLSLQW